MEFLIPPHLKSRLADIGLLVTRIGFGLTMAILHGWPKLANFSERSETFQDPLGVGSTLSLTLAVSAEFFASLLLVLGLFTRVATIPLLCTIFVIVFLVQAGNPFGDHPYREVALLFGFSYVLLLFTGPGRISLDHLIETWWKKKNQ